jgi:tetratricopeptide (TPR) repeat protein
MRLNDDFSAVRNAMIEKASCPWLLKCDADSRIAFKDIRLISRIISDNSADAFILCQRNYSNLLQPFVLWHPCRGEYPAEETFSRACGYCDSEQIFLFRKLPDVRYRFPIHESLQPSLDKGGYQIKKTRIVFHHFEYFKGMKHHFRKHRYYVYLQRKSARFFPNFAPNRFNLIADTLLTGGAPETVEKEARRICRKWPRVPDYHALRGLISMLRGDYITAQEHLRRAVLLGRKPEHLCLAGWCQLRRNNLIQARRLLGSSLKKSPGNPLALNLLAICTHQAGNHAAAIKLLDRALTLLPCYEDARFNKDLIYKYLNHDKSRNRPG